MDQELLNLCKQIVTRYAYTSTDKNNDYTWSATSTTFLARVEFNNQLIRDVNGQETLSTCQIYCNGTTTIDTRDKITYTGAIPTYPEILKIESQPDENGAIYYKCIYTR